MPRVDVPSTFIGWLYRPYFDFGDWEADGNSAVEGLTLAIRSLVEESDAYPRVHGFSPPSVRREIVRHAMLPEYLLDDPNSLRPAHARLADTLRTARPVRRPRRQGPAPGAVGAAPGGAARIRPPP